MRDLAKNVLLRSSRFPCCIVVYGADGQKVVLGSSEPVLSVHVRNASGERALRSLRQLAICEAYVRGDIDLDGDLIAAASLQSLLSDRQVWIKTWRRLKPLLLGRERCNPSWISKHYDSSNIQLVAADREYHTYTPGTYVSDTDTLEHGARRKLSAAFDFLDLQKGKTLLDVGFGWGGFLRFSAARRVRATGITLSRHQFEFVQEIIRKENLPVSILYEDFFSFKPVQKFDALSMMGVIEDLSDYPRVMRRLDDLVKPGGRVYLDFAADRERFGTSSFVSKYIWPGTFRMVYMPELIASISESPFEIVELHNDRHNYYLWARESVPQMDGAQRHRRRPRR